MNRRASRNRLMANSIGPSRTACRPEPGSVSGEVLFVGPEAGHDLLRQGRFRLLDGRQELCGCGPMTLALEVLPLEGHLRRLACRELNICRGEQLTGRHQSAQVKRLVGDLLGVAFPDRLARLGVRRPDREHVVKTARPQERRVEPTDPVGGADQQVVSGTSEPWDLLQELFGKGLSRNYAAVVWVVAAVMVWFQSPCQACGQSG